MKSVFAGNKAKFAYFSFIFIIISTAMYTFYAKEPHWWYIVWNDILAVIPLFAAMLCEHYFSKKKSCSCCNIWIFVVIILSKFAVYDDGFKIYKLF